MARSADEERAAKLAMLRAAVRVGLDELDRGESLSEDEVFQEILAMDAPKHRGSASPRRRRNSD